MKANLTPKHLKFIDEYIQHGIGSKAVVACGMSEKGASVTANRFLKDPRIVAELARRRRPIERKSELTAEKILKALNDLVDFDPAQLFDEVTGKLLPINQIPVEARKALTAIDMDKGTVKHASRLGALELSSKLLGMIREQAQTQAAVQIIIAPHPELPPAPAITGKLLPEW